MGRCCFPSLFYIYIYISIYIYRKRKKVLSIWVCRIWNCRIWKWWILSTCVCHWVYEEDEHEVFSIWDSSWQGRELQGIGSLQWLWNLSWILYFHFKPPFFLLCMKEMDFVSEILRKEGRINLMDKQYFHHHYLFLFEATKKRNKNIRKNWRRLGKKAAKTSDHAFINFVSTQLKTLSCQYQTISLVINTENSFTILLPHTFLF